MRWLLRRLVALRELAVLAAKTRFRLRGEYWSWRRETAFGADPSTMPTGEERREAIIDYANWVASMRMLRRRRGR